MVSQNSARLLNALFGVSGSGRVLVPINFRLVAEEVKYIVGAQWRPGALRRPRTGGRTGRRGVRVQVRHRQRHRRAGRARRAAAVGVRRGRHRHHQLHQRHHRPPQGRAADPPQHLAQRHHVRLAAGHQRPRRVPAHPAAVPLQRLGRAVRSHRHGRAAHHPAQDRRHRDPPPRAAARRHRDVRGARRCQRGPRRSRHWEGEIPGRDRVRIVCAGAPPPTKTIERDRDRAGLGVHPDLRPHRDHAAAHHEPQPRRVRRPLPRRPRHQAQPCRCAGHRRGGAHLPRRRDPRPRQPHHGRLLGQPEATADAIHAAADAPEGPDGSTPATAASSTTSTTSPSATARRT
jgi:hypothetical protein